MQTTILINTDDLNTNVIDRIKKMFPHQTIKITIQQVDKTEHRQNNPKNKKNPVEQIKEYEANEKIILQGAHELL